MNHRPLFSAEHEVFRASVRQFIAREIAPHHADWEEKRRVPRSLWAAAGRAGLLCTTVPESLGGPGGDFLYACVVLEELARAGASGPGFGVHSDIVAPYVLHHGSPDQQQAWLPRLASGEAIGAIAMTEPGTGSDLQAITTRAERHGGGYRLTGAKTFISNGQNADLVIVAAKTDPTAGARGVSLFLVDAGKPGFSRGRNLDKLGLHAQDTSELFFDGVELAEADRLGPEGAGFKLMMSELAQERLIIAVGALASAEAVFEQTVDYAKTRKAFGKTLIEFQNTLFTLARIRADLTVARPMIDECIALQARRELDPVRAMTAKYWMTEMQFRITDQCLQVFGGYGYMREYPVARAWADARVQRIYGGSSEVMLEMIGRSL